MNKNFDKELKESVMGVIEKEKITPKPKWHFLLHEGVVWAIIAASLVLGSIATTLSIYIAGASRFMVRQIHLSDMHTLFAVVPVLWILLILAGVFYTVHALKNTRQGYRWNPSWLVLGALCASVVFGWSAHAAGLGGVIDRYLLEEMPLYKPLTGFNPTQYMDQEQGVVAGVVESLHEDGFVMRKIDGELLDVRIIESTVLHARESLKEGIPIRVVGTTTKEKTFNAHRVGAFHGRGGRMRGNAQHNEFFKKENEGVKENMQ